MKMIFATLRLALIGALFATYSKAAPPPRNSDTKRVSLQAQPGKLFTTRAKVAYYYSRDGGVDTQKNVASFTNPSTGVYCIKPSVPLGYPKVYPHVTVDWGNSIGNVLFAYVQLHADDCAGAEYAFEVLTYTGSGTRSSDVSFIFSVP